MTALIRSLFNSSFKHKKLSEEWGWKKKFVQDSEMQERNFICKSLGSTLISDPADTRLKEEAVKMIVLTIKASGREPEKVRLDISAEELKILTHDGREVTKTVSIYDISYCMADSHYDRVFAIYVATQGSDMINECHAFLCPSAKAARFVALSISEAFLCAYTQYIGKQYDGGSLSDAQKDKPVCDSSSVSEPDLSRDLLQITSTNSVESMTGAVCIPSNYRQTMSKSGKKAMQEWNSSHTNSLFSFESENEFNKPLQRNSLSLDGEAQPDTFSVSSWDNQFADSANAQKGSFPGDLCLTGLSISPPLASKEKHAPMSSWNNIPWLPNSSTSPHSLPPLMPQANLFKNSKQRWTVFDDL